MMWNYALALEANVLMWLIGDATWAAISKYDYNAEACGFCDLWTCPTLDAQPGQPWKAMLFNLFVKGAALRQNKRQQETRLANAVELCGLPGPTQFVPIQVPFRGGCKGWSSDQGLTDEERFLVRHDVCFTDALVDLVNTEDSTDVHNFNSHATKRVLRHALERVQEVLDLLKDSISVQSPVIVCVLSDGWNRSFRDSADRSRYWRSRLYFSKCTNLSHFKKWCDHYGSCRPRNTDGLLR